MRFGGSVTAFLFLCTFLTNTQCNAKATDDQQGGSNGNVAVMSRRGGKGIVSHRSGLALLSSVNQPPPILSKSLSLNLDPVNEIYRNVFYSVSYTDDDGGNNGGHKCEIHSEVRAHAGAGEERVDLEASVCINEGKLRRDSEKHNEETPCSRKTGSGERKQGYDYSRAMVQLVVEGTRDLLQRQTPVSTSSSSLRCLSAEPTYDAFYINQWVNLPTTILGRCNITTKTALRPSADVPDNHGQLIRTRFEVEVCFMIAYSHGRTICKSYFSGGSEVAGTVPSRSKMYDAYLRAIELGLQSRPDCR